MYEFGRKPTRNNCPYRLNVELFADGKRFRHAVNTAAHGKSCDTLYVKAIAGAARIEAKVVVTVHGGFRSITCYS